MKAIDKETNSVHKIISIDIDNNQAVLESEQYGRTSQSLDKIIIFNRLYISVIHMGQYEDKTTTILYVGESHEDAVQTLKNNLFSKDESLAKTIEGRKVYPINGDINYAWIEHWENGSKIKEEEIYS
jgi:hypothetical protein